MSALGVSDHALMRFMERGADIPVEQLRANLAASLGRAHRAARSITESDYLIRADGLLFVVRGQTVVSCLNDKDAITSAAALAGKRI